VSTVQKEVLPSRRVERREPRRDIRRREREGDRVAEIYPIGKAAYGRVERG